MQPLSKISQAARGALGVWNLLRQRDFKERHAHLSNSLKKHICLIQGQLAEYFFLGGEYHKTLRVSVNNYKLAKDDAEKESTIIEIKKNQEILKSFLKVGQAKACKTTFDSLTEYFQPRFKQNLHEPRFSIKLIQKGEVFAFLRSNGSANSTQPIKDAIEKNTGFKYIQETGAYYFCNDIPGAAKSMSYNNPRLRNDGVATYENTISWKSKRVFSFNEPIPDKNWIACWNSGINNGSTATPQQCYKSTLIVPMTLKHDQVSVQFWNLFNEKNITIPDSEKSSFGFLCLDCHEENYFDRETDSRVGYVLADLLSLFFVVTYTFESLSETYNEASSILAHNS